MEQAKRQMRSRPRGGMRADSPNRPVVYVLLATRDTAKELTRRKPRKCSLQGSESTVVHRLGGWLTTRWKPRHSVRSPRHIDKCVLAFAFVKQLRVHTVRL